MESFHPHRDTVRKIKTFRAGFTLVELLVVFSIIAIISGVVFTSQSYFNKTLILANTAYDVALSIRSAEMYGLGGRAISMTPTGYGVHFDRATPNSFILFGDTYPAPSISSVCHTTLNSSSLDAQSGNCSYESGQDAMVLKYTLGNSIVITDFCALSSGNWSCAYARGGNLTTMDVVFARPNPEPLMSMNGMYSTLAPATAFCLELASPQGGARFVEVLPSGQITTSITSCP